MLAGSAYPCGRVLCAIEHRRTEGRRGKPVRYDPRTEPASDADHGRFKGEPIVTLPRYGMKQASFPEMYERWLVGPLFRPWAELTLDDVRLSAGDRLLDIACGTGIVARVARERLGDNGHVVGIDISSEMLAVARALAPAIDWREGNASALPLRQGEQFDVVVCQQGCSSFPIRSRRPARCGGPLRTVAGLRSPHGAPMMKSRSCGSCDEWRSVTWARWRISGTVMEMRPRLQRCCGTPGLVKSDQGPYQGSYASQQTHGSCEGTQWRWWA